MKKHIKLTAILLAIALLAVGLVACDEKTVVSAYDIAVQNGFTGTEQEWLDSLHGRDGANGLDGRDGVDGKDGKLVTVEEMYDSAVAAGYKGTYLDFIKEYLHADVSADNTYAVSKAIRSAVIIVSNFTIRQYEYNFWGQATGRYRDVSSSSGGAGVIYKLDGNGNAYIITNFHVVYDPDSIQKNHVSEDISLYLYGAQYEEKKIPATFVGGSAFYDIAVLRVSASEVLKSSDAVAVEVSDETVAVGQTAMAIGFPAGKGMSVTSGIVSVDSERIDVQVDGVNAYDLRVMRVDTAINSGNSGGGLFDSHGKLIGIVNAKYNNTQIENIGYAIPKEVAIGVTDNIIHNCANDPEKIAVYRCIIGVTTKTAESKAVYDEPTGKTIIKETVAVDSLTEGGAAEGTLMVGDILLGARIGDKRVKIERSYDLIDFLLSAKLGDTVEIDIERDGSKQTVSVTFAEKDVIEYFTR